MVALGNQASFVTLERAVNMVLSLKGHRACNLPPPLDWSCLILELNWHSTNRWKAQKIYLTSDLKSNRKKPLGGWFRLVCLIEPVITGHGNVPDFEADLARRVWVRRRGRVRPKGISTARFTTMITNTTSVEKMTSSTTRPQFRVDEDDLVETLAKSSTVEVEVDEWCLSWVSWDKWL